MLGVVTNRMMRARFLALSWRITCSKLKYHQSKYCCVGVYASWTIPVSSRFAALTTTTTTTITTNSGTTTKPFLLTDIGEGIQQVEILEWYIKVGDHVKEFDTVCQVQSDKATVDITSRFEGRVSSLASNDIVRVGEPLMFIDMEPGSGGDTTAAATATGDNNNINNNNSNTAIQNHPNTDDEMTSGKNNNNNATSSSIVDDSVVKAPPSSPVAAIDTMEAATTTATEATESSTSAVTRKAPNNPKLPIPQMSPAVRKLVKEYSLRQSNHHDTHTIVGTGPNGRILKGDVLLRQQQDQEQQQQEQQQQANREPQQQANRVEPTRKQTLISLRGHGRMMFDSMTRSLERPHMSLTDEMIVDAVWKDNTKAFGNVSFLAIFIKAVSCALLHYPRLNATSLSSSSSSLESNRHNMMNDTNNAANTTTTTTNKNELQYHPPQQNHQLIEWEDHNIGIAMDTSHGLVVPVIHQCQNRSMEEIQNVIDQYKGQSPNFAVKDLKDATFTISNIGSTGAGLHAQAVLGGNAIAMVVVGRTTIVPMYDGQTFQPRNRVLTTWTADHRFVDGATLARLHRHVRSFVEEPKRLLVQLK